jgi:chorismate mutase
VVGLFHQVYTSYSINTLHMMIDDARKEIDRVDYEIVRLIARRQELAGKIARIKISSGLSVHDEERTEAVLEGVFNRAVENRIDPVSVQKIFETLILMSEERQRECSGDGNLP